MLRVLLKGIAMDTAARYFTRWFRCLQVFEATYTLMAHSCLYLNILFADYDAISTELNSRWLFGLGTATVDGTKVQVCALKLAADKEAGSLACFVKRTTFQDNGVATGTAPSHCNRDSAETLQPLIPSAYSADYPVQQKSRPLQNREQVQLKASTMVKYSA